MNSKVKLQTADFKGKKQDEQFLLKASVCVRATYNTVTFMRGEKYEIY